MKKLNCLLVYVEREVLDTLIERIKDQNEEIKKLKFIISQQKDYKEIDFSGTKQLLQDWCNNYYKKLPEKELDELLTNSIKSIYISNDGYI